MSSMNISPEAIQEAINKMAGEDVSETNEVLAYIEVATSGSEVKNVTKIQNGELRCVVSTGDDIKPTTIKNGATFQEYDSEVDTIAWITIVNNNRSILIQDNDGIREVDPYEFKDIFGNKTGYALSYLSSFNSNNNILLDNEKVTNYENALEYTESLIGSLDDDLKTVLTGICANTKEFDKVINTWDDAKVIDLSKPEDCNITWGCRVRTEDQYVEFETTYAILWIRPIIDGEEETPDALTQIITRQVDPNKLPTLAADSKATFLIDETLNEQVLAYALVCVDVLSGYLNSIQTFKTASFDKAKTSF